MKWRGRRQSERVEVRGGGGKLIGGGIGGIIVAAILWLLFDVNPMTALQMGQSVTQGNGTQPASAEVMNSRDVQFVKTVLADTEDVWQQIFQESGANYKPPRLVIFSGSTHSGCGNATAATGPFYCPADETVYLDTSFFVEMKQKLGITGDKENSGGVENQNKAGDFAQAYVIAHEVGHHVQTLLGISQKVSQASRQVSQAQANQLSVRQELQADCFAGVWANRNQQRIQFLENGDIEEALHAASQIGDDRLAHAQGRAAVPDNFTHGTSEQRVNWFVRGLKSGNIESCDTFSGTI